MAKKTTLVFLFITAMCLHLFAATAWAAITSYAVQDQDQKVYEYLLRDLIDSYNARSQLWQDFDTRVRRGKVLAVFDNKSNRYVDFPSIILAYNAGQDIMKYTESSEAAAATLPGVVQAVSLSSAGTIVITEKNISGPSQALAAVNAANTETIAAVLTGNAEALGLNRSDFEALNSYGRGFVSAQLIAERPAGGYGSAAAVKTVFENSIRTAQAALATAVAAINEAGAGRLLYDPAAAQPMRTALKNHGSHLDLNVARYNNLHTFSQDWVAMRMVAHRRESPYASPAAILQAFNRELEFAENRITVTYTSYNITLDDFVSRQLNKNPQTDLYGGWTSAQRADVAWHMNPENFSENPITSVMVEGSGAVNLREQPTTDSPSLRLVTNRDGALFVIEQQFADGYTWYRVLTSNRIGWVREDVVTVTSHKSSGIFQFMTLTGSSGIPEDQINHLLPGAGILQNRGAAFIEATRRHNISEIFLIALARHETGDGTSILARGLEYDGPDGMKTVYNMYGVGAVDADPINEGARFAYERGWFTPELAIIGGAEFAASNYIHRGQNTLYKMRWNPADPNSWRQYATDIGWAYKQARRIQALIDTLYATCETYTLRFDIPLYRQ